MYLGLATSPSGQLARHTFNSPFALVLILYVKILLFALILVSQPTEWPAKGWLLCV